MEKKLATFSTKNGYVVNVDLNSIESVMDISSSRTSDSNTVIEMKSGTTHFVMQRFETVNNLWQGGELVTDARDLESAREYCIQDVEETLQMKKILEQLSKIQLSDGLKGLM